MESLSLFLAANLNSDEPLLPNLRYLKIEWNRKNNFNDDYIALFLVPTLRVLKIAHRAFPHPWRLEFIDIMKARGCDLETFIYCGSLCQYLPEAITSFKNLRNVRMPLDYRSPRQKTSITIVEFLTSLPSLCPLTCNLTAFSRRPPGESLLRHSALQMIDIGSPWTELNELFYHCVFSSVTKVKIALHCRVPDLEGLNSCCPHTRYLDLHITHDRLPDPQPFDLKHLTPLLSLPMEDFTLQTLRHNLTSSDFYTIAESWPNLHSLEFDSFTRTRPLLFLPAFSNHTRLEYLNLSLHLCCLYDDIPNVPDLMRVYASSQSNRSCLRTVYFFSSLYHGGHTHSENVTPAKKRILLEYLLLLFPMMEQVDITFGRRSSATCGDSFISKLQHAFLELNRF